MKIREGQGEPIAAIVLAAGAATRFGKPKQNLLLPTTLIRLNTVNLKEIVVVEGAHPISVSLPTRASLVKCPQWENGPGASLTCGLKSLSQDIEAAVVVLADGPNLDPRAVERLISAWREKTSTALAATYSNTRSHPVLLERSVWNQIPLTGGRDLPTKLIDCSDLRHPGDIDTELDLTTLKFAPNP